MRAVWRLRFAGVHDAAEMPVGAVFLALDCLGEEEDRDLLEAAIGTRAGGADEKSFKDFTKGLI